VLGRAAKIATPFAAAILTQRRAPQERIRPPIWSIMAFQATDRSSLTRAEIARKGRWSVQVQGCRNAEVRARRKSVPAQEQIRVPPGSRRACSVSGASRTTVAQAWRCVKPPDPLWRRRGSARRWSPTVSSREVSSPPYLVARSGSLEPAEYGSIAAHRGSGSNVTGHVSLSGSGMADAKIPSGSKRRLRTRSRAALPP
jgi:hypothetical protein